jgi:CRP/FNR family transcriptional regulator
MTFVADFPFHRSELRTALRRGSALLTHLLAESPPCHFKNRDEIIRAGKPCDMIFRLQSGWAGRTRVLEDGRRSITSITLPGELFGVESLFVTEQPDAVVSFGNATVLAIHHDRLRELFESDPRVALRIALQLAEGERRLRNHMIGLGRASATEHIAMMLLELHGRLGRTGLHDSGTYRCPLTQQDIADFVGLTPVHVNRVLRWLHAEGLATVSRGLVQIHDVAALHKLAQPAPDIFERSPNEQLVAQLPDQEAGLVPWIEPGIDAALGTVPLAKRPGFNY